MSLDIQHSVNKEERTANISEDIMTECNRYFDTGNYLVLAGKNVYNVLTWENKSHRLSGSDIKFVRSEAVGDFDAIVVNLNSLENLRLAGYNL